MVSRAKPRSACGFATTGIHRKKGRLVIGYHLVWTAYGCWLPNDPRGSMSRATRSDKTCILGTRHYGRKQSQPNSYTIREFYESADDILQHQRLEVDRS